MTENKIKPTMEQTIYCLKAASERYPEVCNECQLYGEVGCDHCYDDANDMAIKFLKELEQYRAIDTIGEFKALKETTVTQMDIDTFKAYIDDCMDDIAFGNTDWNHSLALALKCMELHKT